MGINVIARSPFAPLLEQIGARWLPRTGRARTEPPGVHRSRMCATFSAHDYPLWQQLTGSRPRSPSMAHAPERTRASTAFSFWRISQHFFAAGDCGADPDMGNFSAESNGKASMLGTLPMRLVSNGQSRSGAARIRSHRSSRHSVGTWLSNTSAKARRKTRAGGGHVAMNSAARFFATAKVCASWQCWCAGVRRPNVTEPARFAQPSA